MDIYQPPPLSNITKFQSERFNDCWFSFIQKPRRQGLYLKALPNDQLKNKSSTIDCRFVGTSIIFSETKVNEIPIISHVLFGCRKTDHDNMVTIYTHS